MVLNFFKIVEDSFARSEIVLVVLVEVKVVFKNDTKVEILVLRGYMHWLKLILFGSL